MINYENSERIHAQIRNGSYSTIRTTVDGLILSQSKLLFFNFYVLVRREAADFIQGRDLKKYDCLEC